MKGKKSTFLFVSDLRFFYVAAIFIRVFHAYEEDLVIITSRNHRTLLNFIYMEPNWFILLHGQ